MADGKEGSALPHDKPGDFYKIITGIIGKSLGMATPEGLVCGHPKQVAVNRCLRLKE